MARSWILVMLVATICAKPQAKSETHSAETNKVLQEKNDSKQDNDLLDSLYVEEVGKSNLVNPFDEDMDNETRELLKDPCYGVECTKGTMCEVVDEEKRETRCICPTTCPEDDSPVCSAYGKEYKNPCYLHLEACALGKTIRIAYEGHCFAKQRACNSSEIAQFPARFMDWMLHLRQEEKNGEVDPNTSLLEMSPAERTTVAQWMFDKLDLESDLVLQDYDLNDMLLYLLPVEHCIDEFLKSCDVDSSKSISLMEWKTCLMPGYNSVEGDYFDI